MDAETDVLYGDIFCFFNAQTDTVLNVEGFCEETAYPVEYDRVQKAVLDWSGALFVIEPKSSFSSREEFRSFVSDNVLALFEQPLSAEGASSEHRYQTSVRKNQMLQRVAFEVESAASNYGMHRSLAVKYNDQVQLRHLNSGRYFAIRSRRLCNTTPIPHTTTSNPNHSKPPTPTTGPPPIPPQPSLLSSIL